MGGDFIYMSICFYLVNVVVMLFRGPGMMLAQSMHDCFCRDYFAWKVMLREQPMTMMNSSQVNAFLIIHAVQNLSAIICPSQVLSIKNPSWTC